MLHYDLREDVKELLPQLDDFRHNKTLLSDSNVPLPRALKVVFQELIRMQTKTLSPSELCVQKIDRYTYQTREETDQ
ncbi:hypothetical protein OSTOST_05250 [Ostertagia ostertagi]